MVRLAVEVPETEDASTVRPALSSVFLGRQSAATADAGCACLPPRVRPSRPRASTPGCGPVAPG